jgi:ABC-type phosphate transport system ATPase subunit
VKVNTILSNNNKAVGQSKTKHSTEAVNVYYGSFQALSNISLEIPERAITAIIGPSACGKSSFLCLFNRMIECMLEAGHGRSINSASNKTVGQCGRHTRISNKARTVAMFNQTRMM